MPKKTEKYTLGGFEGGGGIIYGQPQIWSPVHTPINWSRSGVPSKGPKVGDIFVMKRCICKIVSVETVRKGQFTHSRYYLIDVNSGERRASEDLFSYFCRPSILFIRK